MAKEKIKLWFKRSLLGLVLLFLVLGQTSCTGGASGLEGLETVSLPVTIAKLVYQLDSESFAYEAAISEEELFSNTELTDDSVIGYITGSLADNHNEATIGVLLDGHYIDTFEITNGSFSYALTLQYYNETLSFVVMGDNTTTENDGVTSSAVMTLLTYDSDTEHLLFIVSVPEENSDDATVISSNAVTDPSADEILPEAGESEAPAEEDEVQDSQQSQDLIVSVRAHSLGRVFPENLNPITLDLADKDEEGQDLTYTIVTEPTLGVADVAGAKITYTPGADFSEDEFSFMAQDLASSVTNVTVTSEAVSNTDLEADEFAKVGLALTAKAGTFAELNGVESPTVAYNAKTKTYEMYFESKFAAADTTCPNGYTGIGHANSLDGVNWMQDDLMIVAPAEKPDYACGVSQPGVLFDGEKFHLVFVMTQSNGVQEGLGYVTSTDGVNFSDPVKITSGIKNQPSLLEIDGRLYVYYLIFDGKETVINREWSNDGGKTWDEKTNYNSSMLSLTQAWSTGTPFENLSRLNTQSVFYDPSAAKPYKMYVVASTLPGKPGDPLPTFVGGLLESGDGTAWTLSDELATTKDPEWGRQVEVLLHGHNYLVWYKSTDADKKAVIDFATTYLNWP